MSDPATSLTVRYPDWFAAGVVALPPGWIALVDRLFVDLASGLNPADRAELSIARVRERDGALEIHAYRSIPAAQALIDAAAHAATKICQSCAAPGVRAAFKGWSATLCPACRERLGTMQIGGD